MGIILARNTQHPVMLHYKVTPRGVQKRLREVGEPNSTLMDEQLKTSRLSIFNTGSINHSRRMVNREGGSLYGTLKFEIEFVSRLQRKKSSLGERPGICIRRIRKLCKQTVQLRIKLYLYDSILESGIWKNRGTD